MNCTLYKTDEVITFDKLLFQNETAATENIYATTPMPAVKKPVYQRDDEEELHTSFEEAISDRLLAVHSRLSRFSNPTLDVHHAGRDTDAAFFASMSARNTTTVKTSLNITPTMDNLKHISRRPDIGWRRAIILVCSAMTFVLLGFDLMGFLVLHLH